MKKVFSFLMIFVIAVLCIGCDKKQKNPTLDLEEKNIELYVGDTYKINPLIENLTGDDLVNYDVADSTIVKVENGLLTALSAGQTKVTLSLKDYPDIKAELNVKVSLKPSLAITGATTIAVGQTTELKAELKNLTGTVAWSSDNDAVATVDQTGKVTGVSAGSAKITAKCGDLEASVDVTVSEDAQIIITGPSTVYVGDTIELSASLWGYTGQFEWESTTPAVATVDQTGKVTGVSEGSATINAKADGKTASVSIAVSKKPELKIIGEETLYTGKQYQFKLTLDGQEVDAVWATSNTRSATVSETGLVTAIATGQVTIYATYNGIRVEFKVKIEREPDQVVLDYDGGVSPELYAAQQAVVSLDLTDYNQTNGYWDAANGYSRQVFLTERSKDPGATFSDRIYIGQNPDTGCYEIVKILMSGGSSWPDGAKYLISISSSHQNYRSLHALTQQLEVGDIVIFTKDVETITETNKCPTNFYRPEIENYVLTIKSFQYKGLPTPSRLGSTFLGWFDESGELVEKLDSITGLGTVKLKAKWEDVNPVTDLTVDNMPTEMTKGDELALSAKVVPDDAFFTTILYSTSNPDIISVDSNGKLVAVNAGKATITLTDYTKRVKKEFEITVYPESSIDVKFDEGYNGSLSVDKTVQMYATFVGKNADQFQLSYESSAPTIAKVDEQGLITALADGKATITIKATSGSSNYSLSVEVKVENLTSADKVAAVIKLLAENNFAVVDKGNACLYNDGTQRYYKATYGSVNNFLFDEFKIDTTYVETAVANTGNYRANRRPTDTIEFVCVHDTATLTGNAGNIASNMASNTNETSIHYVVGSNMIYQVVPEEHIAFHAGDGTGVPFQWNASGVKTSDNSAPKITVVKEGDKYYFAINGETSKLEAPITDGKKTVADPENSLTSLGPTWKIENGEYYIGTTWVCFTQVAAGAISSHGGNNNSIGIETCVNAGGDVYDTWQRTAKLVADICIRNNLDLTRVKQHNTFSGKNCPQVLLAGNYWESFMKMVEVAYTIQKDYSDVTITMKSNDPELVDNTGRVIKAPSITTTVSYDVTVSDGTNSQTITLYSVIPGSTTWEQWNGSYKSSLIWNNGNFAK